MYIYLSTGEQLNQQTFWCHLLGTGDRCFIGSSLDHIMRTFFSLLEVRQASVSGIHLHALTCIQSYQHFQKIASDRNTRKCGSYHKR